MINPVTSADIEHLSSLHLTSQLVCLLTQQTSNSTGQITPVISQKSRWMIWREKDQRHKEHAAVIKEQLPPSLQYAMQLASEKGASSWLSALPLRKNSFDLSKSDFRDALCLRYGWQLSRMPSHCVCGKQFNTEHVLSCPNGGLPMLRHNKIRDYLATRLSEVCSNFRCGC